MPPTAVWLRWPVWRPGASGISQKTNPNQGGMSATGAVTINANAGNAVECWDLVSNVFLNDGDVIRIDTGNSGGAGDPK